MAKNITNQDFIFKKNIIDSDHVTALNRCKLLDLTANELCVAEADGMKDIDNSELLADYDPTVKSRHHAMVVRAETNYKIALVICTMDPVLDKKECRDRAATQKRLEVDHADSFWNRFNL